VAVGRRNGARRGSRWAVAEKPELGLVAVVADQRVVRVRGGEQHVLLPRGAQLGERGLDRRERDHRRQVDAVEFDREGDRVVVPVQALLGAVGEHGHVGARDLVLLARDRHPVLDHGRSLPRACAENATGEPQPAHRFRDAAEVSA